jgi:hypothetical protein
MTRENISRYQPLISALAEKGFRIEGIDCKPGKTVVSVTREAGCFDSTEYSENNFTLQNQTKIPK